MTSILDIYWQDFDKAMEAQDITQATSIAEQARRFSEVAANEMILRIAAYQRTTTINEEPEL